MERKTIRLGLVGKDVSKSSSDKIHAFILDKWGYNCEYEKFSVNSENFDGAMRSLLGDFDGFNITIPYKRDVFEYLDSVEGDAFACGAVNTVVNRKGYNTDGVGFMLMLENAGISVKDKKVLVLGAGGSGRSGALAMKNAGANVYMYRRNKEELEEVCAQLGVNVSTAPEKGGYDIIINCTGVGMHDTVGKSPVEKSAFDGAKIAVDLIYNPKESAFLQIAKDCGLKTCNGSAMLFYQAYYADCLYTQRQADANEAKILYLNYLEAYGE